MTGQPGAHRGVLVSGQVVDHDVQLAAGIGGGDLLEEGQGFLVAVPVGVGLGHLAGGHLECGEQRGGAVPDVVRRVPLGRSRSDGSTGAVRSSAWTCGFSSTQSTTALSGGCRYSPTTSPILPSSSGSVENLKVSARQGCTPKRCQIRAMVACEIGVPSAASASASSREDQCVAPRAVGGWVRVSSSTRSRSASGSGEGLPDRGRSASPGSPRSA